MVETTLNPHTAEWAHLRDNQYCTVDVCGGNHEWLNHKNKYHRVDESGIQDGPAFIGVNGYQEWCLDGKVHCLDGPAIIYASGNQEWYLEDQELTQEEWTQDLRVILYNSRTQQGAEEWLKRM